MRELFGKIKMKDVGRDQEDRLRLSIFIKRQKEDHNFLEKLLQQSKDLVPSVQLMTSFEHKLKGEV